MAKVHDLPGELKKNLSEDQALILSNILDEVSYPLGQMIFNQGEMTQYLFILQRGCVDIIHKPYDGPALVIAHIFEGDIFGWSAVLKRDVYTSSAICLTSCSLYQIRPDRLRWLCETHQDTGIIFLQHIASALSKQLLSKRSDIFEMLKKSIIPS